MLFSIFVPLFGLFVVSKGSDAPCHAHYGTCQDSLDINNPCRGNYRHGMCSGAATRLCCLPQEGDEQCAAAGGRCQDDGLTCVGGAYRSGLCAGSTSRRCCVHGYTVNPVDMSEGCPNIISRAEWGARPPTGNPGQMPGPAKYVFLHHGAGGPCHTTTECAAKVRAYQAYHLDGHKWSDIGYNFAVGEDGNAYMARGWTEVGAHTKGYNSVGVAICVIGDFTNHAPNAAAMKMVQRLIACGLEQGHIRQDYTLKGHPDVGNTECPGQTYYDLIQNWPHYRPNSKLYP